MKKLIALILSLIMLLGAVSCALAEGGEPMFATVGDALAAAGEHPVAGGEEDYYAVVTEKDGKYYRSVAITDDRYRELQEATWTVEPEQIEEAFAAVEEYVKTLPIAYTEVFTAEPMSQEEIDTFVGKTIAELREAGLEDRESGSDIDEKEELIIVYVMRSGVFDYRLVVDADFDTYQKAQEEEGVDAGGAFVVRSARFEGITREACFRRFHTDGTLEEEPDPFEGYDELITVVQELIEKIQSGEEVDLAAFAAELKERFPNLADTIDMYVQLLQTVGASAVAAMLTPAEE